MRPPEHWIIALGAQPRKPRCVPIFGIASDIAGVASVGSIANIITCDVKE